ncbi:MAG: spore coat protein [Acidobacteria bacterium]|nr:MAG: spore coat protein [Acidobacteriota bacterium]
MKGIILAGGLGQRLLPLTKVTNKHLLPVYDRPMIYYPIQTMVEAGITDLMVVTGGPSAGDFLRLLGNGKEFGLQHIHYGYQEGEGGIAAALDEARFFAGSDSICVILGDNLIEGSIRGARSAYEAQGGGARIVLKEVPDPQRFGVPVLENGKVVRIDEKPEIPQSSYAVTGIYFYDSRVWEILNTLVPSDRGELEITDVNNQYIREGRMEYEILEGWWTDAGTFESLLHANQLVTRGKVGKPGGEDRD